MKPQHEILRLCVQAQQVFGGNKKPTGALYTSDNVRIRNHIML